MKVYSIYDQGSSPRREDGFVISKRTLGVLDGINIPYSPKHPQKEYYGFSGAEVLARDCEAWLYNHDINRWVAVSLQKSMESLSSAMCETQKFKLLADDLEDGALLAGATFAFVRIHNDAIEIAQGGDCMVVVEFTNEAQRDIIVSPNQVRTHDTEMNAEIERVLREVAQELHGCALEDVPDEKMGQVRGEMWDRFYYTLLEARRQNVNNTNSSRGYGILNGQSALQDMLWTQRFPREEVANLVLFSDGIVPWSIMKNRTDIEIGRSILEGFKNHGLAGILTHARRTEASFSKTSYQDQAEATAIALTF